METPRDGVVLAVDKETDIAIEGDIAAFLV